MRVIAGKARSMPLKCIEGMNTRPTTDKIKETLFNIINNYIPGCRFLDIFCGSGAIGIEALSRGAKECTFIDSSKAAIECTNQNLLFTKLIDGSKVICKDALSALNNINRSENPYDIIYIDPPYNQLLEKSVVQFLLTSNLINSDTLIIIEASSETEIDYFAELGYEVTKIKEYKTNKHIFMYLSAEE